VSAVAVAPDGKLLAYADNRAVHLCETDTGKEVRQVKTATAIALAFAPDGKTLAIRERNQRVWLADPQTGKELRQLHETEPPNQLGGFVFFVDDTAAPQTRALAFSPDGQQVAAASGSTVRVWETATGNERSLADGHRRPPSVLTLARDGRTVVSWGPDRVVRRWEAATGKSLGAFPAPPKTTRAAFSPDGRIVALANADGSIHLHDIATGKQLHQLPGPADGSAALAFAPNGKLLAARGNSELSIRLYDVVQGAELRQLTLRAPKNAAGNGVIVLGGNGGGFRGRGAGLAFSPDGSLLVTPGPTAGDAAHPLVVFDVATGKELRQIEPSQAVTSFAFSPDGRVLATENADRTVTLWEVASGKEQTRLGKPAAERRQANAGMMNFAVVIQGLDGGVSTPAAGPVGLAFSPDSRALAVRGPDQSVHVWDVTAAKEIGQLAGHGGRVEAVAFAPDGKTLASSASDTTILLWDTAGPMKDLAKPQAVELPAAAVDTLWSDLASVDAAKALRSVHALVGAPRQAVTFLGAHLKPAERVDPQKLAGWISDLDSDKFAVRQEAVTNLLKVGEQAVPALRQVLASSPPLETRKRTEELVDRLTGGTRTAEQLRLIRAVEALERIGTPEARQVLRALAQGAPGALPTREAQAALQRVKDEE
jgi:WD40 repeat protein